MKIQVTSIVFALISFLSVRGQVKLEGVVRDKDSLPIPFVSVSAFLDSKEIAYTYADSTGAFKFSFDNISDRIKLVASYLNIKSDSFNVNPETASNIVLIVDVKQREMKSVTVTSKIPIVQRKVDRIIYNLEGNSIFENKSLIEILKSLPRITINGFNISLTGQGTVGVMINNRLLYMTGKDLLDYLAVFRNDIVSIEVIPNPPASYDAEGVGGLINIVTKKGKTTGLSGDIQSVFTKNTFHQVDNYANLRYRNKNLNVTAGIGGGTGNYREFVKQEFLFKNDRTAWRDIAKNKNHYSTLNSSLAIDYQISKTLSLNVSSTYSFFNSKNRLSKIFYYESMALLDSLGLTSGNETANNKTFTTAISLHNNFKKGNGYWDISLDIFKKKSFTDHNSLTHNYQNDGYTPTNTEIGLLSYGNAPRNISSIKMDINLPNLFSKWDTEAGFKYTFFHNSSRIGYDKMINGITAFPGVETSNQFSYKEHNVATYVQISKEFKKWILKGGVRYEGTFTHGIDEKSQQNFNYTFNNLFPSFFGQFKIKEDNSISFSYTRRISRPRLWDVNPYRWYTSINSFSVGNPGLVPSLQDNFGISLALWNKLYVSTYYNRQNKPIVALPFNNGFQIEYKKLNSGVNYNYGINVDFYTTFFKILQNTFTLNAGSYKYKTSFAYSLSKTPLLLSFQSNHSADISKTISASLSFYGVLPGGGNTISRQSGNYKVDFSITKQFFNKRVESILSVEDIFKSSSSTYRVETPSFRSESYNYYDFRYVSLSIKYKFGKQLKSARVKSGILGTDRMRL